jgi:hypothetical protein
VGNLPTTFYVIDMSKSYKMGVGGENQQTEENWQIKVSLKEIMVMVNELNMKYS